MLTGQTTFPHFTLSSFLNLVKIKAASAPGRSINSRLAGLIVFLYWGVTYSAHAQLEQTAAPELGQLKFAQSAINKGYWKLKTEAATRRTQVQFFGVNQELLYEETLPEKTVKLSRYNQLQLDQLLAELLSNQLLTTRLHTKILLPTPDNPASGKKNTRLNARQNMFAGDASSQVQAYVNRLGKLHVLVENPDRWRYTIKIFDSANRLLHEEFKNYRQFHHALDVSGLLADAYQVQIRMTNKPMVYRYKMIIGNSGSHYSMTSMSKDILPLSSDQSLSNL